MNKPVILVVEDDNAVRNLIVTTLETHDYKNHTSQTGKQAIIETASKKPDIMLLDLGLPDIDGVEIIKKVRTWTNMPIIVISARSEDHDKIDEELLARLRVVLRRLSYNQNQPVESSEFVNGDLRIDYASGCAYLKDKELHLTPIEYKLLCLLSKNVGKVLTHTFITKEIWGNTLESDVASLRVFMATLRKKIEANPAKPKYIQTHVGVGYRMLRIE